MTNGNNRESILGLLKDSAFIKMPKFLLEYLEPEELYLFSCMLEHAIFHLDTEKNEDGWFYLTYPQILKYYKIKRSKATRIINKLYKLKLIDKESTKKSMDHKCYYHINETTLIALLNVDNSENPNKLRCSKINVSLYQNQPIVVPKSTSNKNIYNKTISNKNIEKRINNNNIEVENDTTEKSHSKQNDQDSKIVNVVPPHENGNDEMELSGDDIMAYEPVGIEVDKKS